MERRALVIAVAVSSGALLLGALLAGHLARLDVQEHRQGGLDLARGSAFALEREIEGSLAAASAMAALAAEQASDRELDGVAERLLALNGGTAHLQLAPDNVIERMWPMAGNEPARGLDLLHHPLHAAAIRRVMETRRPSLYGPFELIQGGRALAIRVPVLAREDGAERYLGLSSAIVRVNGLLEKSRIPSLVAAGYDWELGRLRPGADPEWLAGSLQDGKALRDAAVVPVELMDQTWTLAVAPRGGWRAGTAPALYLAAGLIALLAGVLAYRITSLPETLRREVAARTDELEVAHREQRRAEEAQRQSQKLEAVGLLAGGIAHDFNNLLVGILGYADLVAEGAAPGSVAEEAAATISQAAQRASELTRQLLAFARVGHRRQDEVDLHALVREVAALLGRTFDKAIRLELLLHAPLHHVRGDPGQLQQVILNLAVNARDAMAAGGTLTLETDLQDLDEAAEDRGLAPGRYLVLSVTDTGVGIPSDRLDRIFEPFFTTKADGRGSGLGLATVYGIVRDHRGAVRVYSEEGVGSRFIVYLPALEAPARAAAPAAAEAPRGHGRVLVVDDEELVRRAAGRMLERMGYEPELAGSGQEALDRVAARGAPPAAVVLDLAMPGMDGRECFRRLRALHPDLPVVVSSGFARNGRAQELLDEGAAAFVQKPYRTAELGRALARAIATVPARMPR
ncbi:MAG TPA: ATP-binding protein [Anaeromyxobacter sp.]|nr:ATP-binding protein [Anaeromyxobacter sp.]